MTELLGGVWLASLWGSAHCVGMCGAYVVLARGSARRQVAYHLGRLVTYVTLGGAAGAIGAAVDLGGAALGMRRLALGLAGLLLVVYGALLLARLRGAKIPLLEPPPWAGALYARTARALPVVRPMPRCFVLGALSTLLPCGWLYAFVATAAGTGSPILGALALLLFWSGTVPALALVGFGAGLLGPLGRRAPAAAAIALIAVGLVALAGLGSAPAEAGREAVGRDVSHAACAPAPR